MFTFCYIYAVIVFYCIPYKDNRYELRILNIENKRDEHVTDNARTILKEPIVL